MKWNEREKAKPLANRSCSAPIVANQNQKPVTSFAQNQFLYFPKTRSSFPISPLFFGKKKKHTESFRWASLTLYVAIRPHPDTFTCPTRARLILPQILYPPAWHSQPFPSSLSKLQSYPRTLLSLTCKGVQFMNPNKPIFWSRVVRLHRFRSKRWAGNFSIKFPLFFYSFFLRLKRSNGNTVRSPWLGVGTHELVLRVVQIFTLIII